MPFNLVGFLWDVERRGYRWVEPAAAPRRRGHKSDPVLASCPGSGSKVKRYAPLDHAGLFRDFADVWRTRAGVLRFANRYGLLSRQALGTPHTTDPDPGQPTGGSLSLWRREITAMRQVVDLWDLHQAGDLQRLARHISWRREPASMDAVWYVSDPPRDVDSLDDWHPDNYDADPDAEEADLDDYDLGALATTEVIASTDHHPDWLERFQPGDVFLPALVVIQRRVNERLQALLSPRMLYDVRQDRMALQLVPSSLLGALWLEFAQAVTESKTFRRCQQCFTWFEIRPPATRSTRLYCSNTCRLRAQRSGVSRARQLHAEGKSAQEIATELGTNVLTVKSWVGGQQET